VKDLPLHKLNSQGLPEEPTESYSSLYLEGEQEEVGIYYLQKFLQYLPKVKERRILHDETEKGQSESDKEFVKNNKKAAAYLLDNAELVEAALRELITIKHRER
jgi:hypothetical protein